MHVLRQLRVSSTECEAAAAEEVSLLKPFFSFQLSGDLFARRLFMAVPEHGNEMTLVSQVPVNVPKKRSLCVEEPSKSSNADSSKRTRTRIQCDGEVSIVTGSIFGCTLANLVAHVSGRGVPGEKASILRSIRRFLAPAAEAVASMTGSDRHYLATSLAACRVVRTQRPCLRELTGKHRVKIDSKYGHAAAGLGSTAAILATVHVLAERPDDCAHLLHDRSLVKVLYNTRKLLKMWVVHGTLFKESVHSQGLGVEFRCIERAMYAARRVEAVCEADGTCGLAAMRLQLTAALEAAYPQTEVSEATHDALCQPRDHLSPSPSPSPASSPMSANAPVDGATVVPLAEIAGSGLSVLLSSTSGIRESQHRDDVSSAGTSTTHSSLDSRASVSSADSCQSLVLRLNTL